MTITSGTGVSKESVVQAESAKSEAFGRAERALASLKPFARIAWEECREPLPDSAGPAHIRWEIYSTWTLLLCLHYSEVETQRCLRAGWKAQEWQTEAQALRHIYLRSRGLRVLNGVLRWLRWARRWGPEQKNDKFPDLRDSADVEIEAYAAYDRTRRTVQLQSELEAPGRDSFALHPDGPLQQPIRFDDGDLADEARLVRQLFKEFRNGNLRKAQQMCADGGQPWRAALLQGMFPYAERDDEDTEVGYMMAVDDEDEEVLAAIKEEHTDWTEIGALEQAGSSNGNPWRKVWKEQCWDTAQRQLQSPDTSMPIHEIALYGAFAGHLEALLPVCEDNWADRVWAEIHCLKEWLVESLLDIGREEWCGDEVYLGEGDGGFLDPADNVNSRGERQSKLRGGLRNVLPADVEATIARELVRIVGASHVEASKDLAGPFVLLQATIMQSAFQENQSYDVLASFRSWLSDGFSGSPCPFVVKQFASHFAIWHKEVVEISEGNFTIEPPKDAVPLAEQNVDDIVRELVGELVIAASGSWRQQCMEGHAVELIAEHTSAMSKDSRVAVFASLLLQLGADTNKAETDLDAKLDVLKRVIWVFWCRFPADAFLLLAVLVHKALHLNGDTLEMELPGIGKCGVRKDVMTEELTLAILSIMVFWTVTRDKAESGEALEETLFGLEGALGSPIPEEAKPETADDFARLVLNVVVVPCFGDVLLSLAVKDPRSALNILPLVQNSAIWRDAVSCQSTGGQALVEVEWFLGLCRRHASWEKARVVEKTSLKCGRSRQGFGTGSRLIGCRISGDSSEGEKARALARNEVLEWAHPRLAQDKALFEPDPGTHTTLSEHQWQRLCSSAACRSLLVLLSVFEGERDFDGALGDLTVAIAQSPWMLQLLSPQHARLFLSRLSLVPTRLEDEYHLAAVRA